MVQPVLRDTERRKPQGSLAAARSGTKSGKPTQTTGCVLRCFSWTQSVLWWILSCISWKIVSCLHGPVAWNACSLQTIDIHRCDSWRMSPTDQFCWGKQARLPVLDCMFPALIPVSIMHYMSQQMPRACLVSTLGWMLPAPICRGALWNQASWLSFRWRQP